MKKAEKRKLKENGVNPQKMQKAIRKWKEAHLTYNPNEPTFSEPFFSHPNEEKKSKKEE